MTVVELEGAITSVTPAVVPVRGSVHVTVSGSYLSHDGDLAVVSLCDVDATVVESAVSHVRFLDWSYCCCSCIFWFMFRCTDALFVGVCRLL